MKLVIDFETYDPYIKKLGPGWATDTVVPLGASLRFEDKTYSTYITDMEKIKELVSKASTLICHEAQYDCGILAFLGVDLSRFTIIDTKLLAKLYNNVLPSYHLDDLAKKFLSESKAKLDLAYVAIRYRLVKLPKRQGKRTPKQKKRIITAAKKFAIEHMDLIQKHRPDLVAKYAEQDTNLTWKLYNLFIHRLDSLEWIPICSDMIKILIKQRMKGVRIGIDRVKEVRDIIYEKEMEAYKSISDWMYISEDINLNSIKQIASVLDAAGIPYPLTKQKNPSITSGWLEEQDHPILLKLKEYRKYQKIRRDFCDTVLELQEVLPEHKRGRVYPHYNVFGARTGRFTSSSPNIMQIPGRDPELGPLVRSMYIPEYGDTWYSLDYSSQESRIQIHYAYLLDLEGANLFVQEYISNPEFDLHQKVADLAGISRKQAKEINLGLSYGMGKAKLGKRLGLNSLEAEGVISKYNTMVPYLKELSDECSNTLKRRGFIYTINDRKSYLEEAVYDHEDKKIKSFEYRGLNSLVQGSAADQIIKAMIELDKAGINVLFSVYDEINISSSSMDEALKAQSIMENCLKLEVPMKVELGCGNNWGEAK